VVQIQREDGKSLPSKSSANALTRDGVRGRRLMRWDFAQIPEGERITLEGFLVASFQISFVFPSPAQ